MTRDEWLSAARLVELRLPALPSDKGALSRLIAREHWRGSPLAREVDGVWEYHRSLLPAEAQAELLARDLAANETPSRAGGRDEGAWAAFEALPERSKAVARERLAVVDQVAALTGGGMKKADAVTLVARRAGVSTSTLWGWLKLCDGRARPDWLAALAPRHRGRTATADCDPRAWDFLVADYLRAERPSFAACHRRMLEAAAEHGWSPLPAAKTLQRRLERQIPAAARTLARYGRDAAARIYPHQTRDRSGFHAMQAVNADGHRFDVFVKFEDGTVGRPVMTAVQDLATGMIVGHRVAETENWTAVRLAFADVVTRYGIPENCWLDNGRAFASKWITGGAKTRFRFTVQEHEPLGVLTQLGIRVHWTTPYHGQAKPIERAFRDLCEEIAKHPACAGAYTGNRPDAKPENYASRAIPIEDFRALVAQEIERHNQRKGRRGSGLDGRSFADAFALSLAAPGTAVTRATAAQRRLLLLAAEGVKARKPNGEIQLAGNRYWDEALVEHMGRQLTVRFDPDDLHQPLAVYTRDGRFICEAAPIETTGFDNAEAAQAYARGKRQWLKGQRELLELERRIGIEAVAELLPKVREPAPAPETKVTRLAPKAPPTGPRAEEGRAEASFSRAVRALSGEVVPITRAREREAG